MSGLAYLLDTNVVIGYLDGKQAARDEFLRHDVRPGNAAISQITRIELFSFSGTSKAEVDRLTAFLSSVAVLMLDPDIEQETIMIRRRTRLKLPDAVIAATATVHSLTLLTLDERFKAALAIR